MGTYIEPYCGYDHMNDIAGKAMIFKGKNEPEKDPRSFSLFILENGRITIKEGVYMERFQHMTDDEAAEFIAKVSEWGAYQEDQQSIHQEYRERLRSYLRANFFPYLIHFISNGTNHLSEEAVQKVISGEKWTNAIGRINTYLKDGDAAGVVAYCRVLRSYYRAMEHSSEKV